MLVSSMMQRPIKLLIDEQPEENGIWDLHTKRNLRSALAFAALTTPDGVAEKDLYENIVEITHYESTIG